MGLPEAQSIIRALDLDEIPRFGDINGGAPDLASALHNRYSTKTDFISLDKNGKFTKPDHGHLKKYQARLQDAGLDASDLRVITSKSEMGIYDVVASINNFGKRFKILPLQNILDRALHDQSRVVVEIKKGTGSYPFLNNYGGCNTLAKPTNNSTGLVVMSVEPSVEPSGQWSKIAQNLAGNDGFFTDCKEHSFLYIPRGDTLVVTFDNLDIAMTKRDDRRPWGFEFIQSQGWSMLGVMANGWTWFRDGAVTDEFNRLRDSGFFEKFQRVVFYGASMGGYAAAAYSGAAKGATVFVISPQSTLDKAVVPWETRYKTAWGRDFSGPYGDAATCSQAADKVHVMYDPYVDPDAAHAARFQGSNVVHWRCPMLGHRLGSSLSQMGILQEIAKKTIEGNLDRKTFYQLLRKRHQFPRYQRELANRALECGHPQLAMQVCEFALSQNGAPYFKKMLTRIRANT